MTTPRLDFWFELASPYSHLAAHRIEGLARHAGVELHYRPFLLGPIFKRQGWDNSPFAIHPAKGAYMWRDMEREAARLGVEFRRPSVFPRNSVAAARIGVAGEGQAWLPAFVRVVYAANFSQDRDIAEPGLLQELLADSGCPEPEVVTEAANGPALKGRLRARTEEAVALGIFGAPSFVVDGEVFWGNDRLEQALDWAQRRGSKAVRPDRRD